jgi:hypothetical protein
MPLTGQFIVGEDYLTVVCAACKGVIPIAQAGKVVYSGPGTLRVGCPFCGVSGEHRPTEAKVRRLEVLPPTAH